MFGLFLFFSVTSVALGVVTDRDITNEFYKNNCEETQAYSRYQCPEYEFPFCTPWSCETSGKSSREKLCHLFDCTVSCTTILIYSSSYPALPCRHLQKNHFLGCTDFVNTSLASTDPLYILFQYLSVYKTFRFFFSLLWETTCWLFTKNL